MFFLDALLDFIFSSQKAAVSKQELYVKFLEIWKNKSYKNIDIIDLRYNSKYYKRKFKSVIRSLELCDELKVIGDETIGPTYFINLRITPINPYKIICDLYPLGYVSHLSAMEIHKLTTKTSDSIYFTTLNRTNWKKNFLSELNKHDYPFFRESYDSEIIELIPRFPTEEKYLNKDLLVFTHKNLMNYEMFNGVRVQELTLLFIEMTRAPQYCGGIDNVISVFKNHAKLIIEDILESTNKNGTNIDKARIGFILDEILRISHPVLEKWKLEMVGQRGGSRKFISYLPFEPKFSPTWNISLNHTVVSQYGVSSYKNE